MYKQYSQLLYKLLNITLYLAEVDRRVNLMNAEVLKEVLSYACIPAYFIIADH